MTVQFPSEMFLYEQGKDEEELAEGTDEPEDEPVFEALRKPGTALFDPAQHGLDKGRARSSVCWAAMQCLYRIADGALTIEELSIVLGPEQAAAAKENKGPLLFGQLPEYKETLTGNVLYTNLKGPIAFSGVLVLVREPAVEVHWATHMNPPWAWKSIHELTFENGVLVKAIDRSNEMKKQRESMGHLNSK